MTPDGSDDAHAVAVEQLELLGLSTYAARTFVALTSLGDGTATDVSEVAEVPRTRVYDAVAELEDRGLVDVQQSTPKRFWSISTETTGRQFEQEYAHRLNRLTEALGSLDETDRATEQRGVWTVDGRSVVTERVRSLVESASEEVVYMTVEDLLTEPVTDALHDASDRGVSIKLGGMSDTTESTLQADIPGADPFESLWDWSDTPAGRLLLVDERKTLASVLVDDVTGDATAPGGPGGTSPDAPDGEPSRQETAIWGTGPTNSLVVVLRAMFTWQLDGTRE